MRNFLMALSAASLVVPVSMALPTTKAEAKKHYSKNSRYYRTKRCTKSGGTTGAIAGGVGGALVGNAVGGGVLGTLGGAAAGALGGRAIDRANTASRRCRYR